MTPEHLILRCLAQIEALLVAHPAKVWYTVEEAAAYLSLTPDALRGRIARQEIPFCRQGKTIRLHRERLDRWLNRGYVPPVQ
jgi:excisionase family DNA binding protein